MYIYIFISFPKMMLLSLWPYIHTSKWHSNRWTFILCVCFFATQSQFQKQATKWQCDIWMEIFSNHWPKWLKSCMGYLRNLDNVHPRLGPRFLQFPMHKFRFLPVINFYLLLEVQKLKKTYTATVKSLLTVIIDKNI